MNKAAPLLVLSLLGFVLPLSGQPAERTILNLALGGNFPAAVNKVKTPYHGLSETTVLSIQKDEPRVLVDWVRVTGR